MIDTVPEKLGHGVAPDESRPTPDIAFDVLVCASRSDIAGLLPTSLSLLFSNLSPLDRVHVVTPETDAVQRLLDRLPGRQAEQISVWSDDEVCPEALDLDPWFRQQYIKLNADRVTRKRKVVCLGADTLILEPVTASDLIDADGRPVIRFFRYTRPNAHLHFERQRVLNVARLLAVEPRRSFLLGDFICDLFLLEVDVLRALRARIAAQTELKSLLFGLGSRQAFDNRFGEWTAYAVFCLDVLAADVRVKPSTSTFFGQIHSQWDLARSDRYASRVIHFATEPGGAEAILKDLVVQGRLSARYAQSTAGHAELPRGSA